MSLKDNVMYVMPSKPISQGHRLIPPVVKNDKEIQRLVHDGHITEWQARLLWLIDVKKQSFMYVARSAGCTRQHVHYAYHSIAKSVAKSEYIDFNHEQNL